MYLEIVYGINLKLIVQIHYQSLDLMLKYTGAK